jgi:hypothetical protein
MLGRDVQQVQEVIIWELRSAKKATETYKRQ